MGKLETLPNFWKNTIQIIFVIILGVLISSLIKLFLFQGFYIPSQSMEPTLQINDRIIVNQLYPTPFSLKRGDIIVFQDKTNWMQNNTVEEASLLEKLNPLQPNLKDKFLIKRVIGLPGDTISYTKGDKYIKINGVSHEESYLLSSGEPSQIDFNIKVPQDSVWVMGDNRNNSSDSRYNQDKNGGFIKYENIIGKAVILYYPLNNATIL